MATPRDIRRLAFQLLFQMDAQGGAGGDVTLHREWMKSAELGTTYAEKEQEQALATALAAFAARAASDAEFEKLAPTWPARRQAAADRAILRLCHYELSLGKAPPKAIVNDAIELAKEFSTDRSPSFVNGLLDKVLKRVTGASTSSGAGASPADSTTAPESPAPGA